MATIENQINKTGGVTWVPPVDFHIQTFIYTQGKAATANAYQFEYDLVRQTP